MPNRIFSVGSFHLGDRQPVYASMTGSIQRTLNNANGMNVDNQKMIVSLKNISVQKSIFELESRLERVNCQLATLERSAFFDQRLLASRPILLSQRDLVTRQISQKRDELSRLIVNAPIAGWFEPALAHPPEPARSPSDIAMGFGTPHESLENEVWTSDFAIGRPIDRGTLVGWITHDRSPKMCALARG